MSTALEVISSVAMIGGATLSALAGIAVLRFPDTRSRVHAATKPQVLGIMLLMLGVGLRLGTWAVVGQLVLIVLLQLFTAPVSAHLVVRQAHQRRGSEDLDDGPHDRDDELDPDGDVVESAGEERSTAGDGQAGERSSD